MRSVATVFKKVVEDQSIYASPHGNVFFFPSILEDDNGVCDYDRLYVYDPMKFSFFVARSSPIYSIRAYVNDIRLFDGTRLGDNLLTTHVELDSTTAHGARLDIVEIRFRSAITPEVLNNGIGVSLKVEEFGTIDPAPTTVYNTPHLLLKGLDNADIPKDAKISSVFLEMSFGFRPTSALTDSYTFAGCMYTIKAEYEYSYDRLTLYCGGRDDGFLEVDGCDFKTDPVEKRYQYMIYYHNGFLGELTDVVSAPTLRNALNSFPSDLTINVAKDADADIYDVDALMVVDEGDPEPAIDHDLSEVRITDGTRSAYGDNTMINVNNDVEVFEYNGYYDGIELDDGEPLVVDDAYRLISPVGSPEGSMFFSGYISKYGIGYGRDRKETATLTVLNHADQYNNIVWSRLPYPVIENVDDTGVVNEGAGDFALGNIPNNKDRPVVNFLVSEFTPASNVKISSIEVKCSRTGSDKMIDDFDIKAAVFIAGNKDADPRYVSPIAYAFRSLKFNYPHWAAFEFDKDVELTAGRKYYIYYRALTTAIISTQYVCLSKDTTYRSWYWQCSVADWNNGTSHAAGLRPMTEHSMQFRLIAAGGNTLVAMYSKDPSYMAKSLVDFGRTFPRYTHIGRSKESIAMSGTVITAKFNINTMKEALDAIISYEPTDWYWYVDQSDFNLYVRPKPSEVTHWFTLHKDIRSIRLEHSMESLKNEVYFTGGRATIEIPDNSTNQVYSGGGLDPRWVSSTIVKPEPDTPYKVFGDVEGKTTYVKVYEYYGNETVPRNTHVAESKSGELTYTYSSIASTGLRGICIACRLDGNGKLSPSKVKFSLSSDQNVYRHLVNETSLSKYRCALVKKTDQRVTNAKSADIIAENELTRSGEPIFMGTVEILRDKHLEQINPGELVGFRNFGNYIDNLKLLATEVSMTKDIATVTLGAFAPKTSKRLEDLKRNMTVLETQMNPAEPSKGEQ